MMDVGFFLERHGKNYAPFESQILPETTKKSVSDYMTEGKVIAAELHAAHMRHQQANPTHLTTHGNAGGGDHSGCQYSDAP